VLADILHKIAGDSHNKVMKPFSPKPSNSGPGRCVRQMVFHSMGIEPDSFFPDRLWMIMDDGNYHEGYTAGWIEESGYRLKDVQKKLKLGFPFNNGYIDGIVVDIMDIETTYDHKDKGTHMVDKFYSGSDLPLDDFTQLAIYSRHLQINDMVNSDQCLLLIRNRDTAQYIEYFCRYLVDEDCMVIVSLTHSNGDFKELDIPLKNIYANAIEKFNFVKEMSEKKKLPHRQYYKDSWRCNYCDWKIRCWEGYDDEKPERAITDLPEEFEETIDKYIKWDRIKAIGSKSFDDIKNYMRARNILHARMGNILIKRKISTSVAGKKTEKYSHEVIDV
jgi:hypothetical protein